MAAFLRSTTADLRAAAGLRLHRYRAISGWRRQFLAVSILTVAITVLLARTLPLSLSSTSGQPSSTSVDFNSSVDLSLFPFPRRGDSSLLPHVLNSSSKSSVSPRSASEAKIDNLSSNLMDPSTSKVIDFLQTPDVEMKSSVRSSTNSEIHAEEVGFRSGDHGRNMTVFPKPEIRSKVVKPGDDERKVTASTSSEIPFRSLPTYKALIFAKKEIENAPLVTDDPDLYAPLFLNVSVFKRSYALMERILKVYIYPDGRKPIFHTPELKGIYASEGWFMKLIEQNRHFVVKDSNRAHLFYLPYSARRLEVALYVPESHNMKPLSRFLKDYVNKISSKYPFWNRTRGSDHFLVACHDWGPYTTTLHDELCKNTIKALCNADVSEGIFLRGKDVSLPETTIRNPRRPLRQVGGRPVSQRHILAFFAGYMHGRVRPVLLEHWGNGKDEDMRIYGPLPNQISRKMSYIEHMKSSKFCICPMGFEVNSPRIVEAIYYECVPVIIADNFVLPFEEVLDWSAFSVIVAEKDIPNLKDILLGIPLRQYIKMQECVKRLQKHFLWHARPEKYDLFHMILHSIWFSRVNHVQPQ